MLNTSTQTLILPLQLKSIATHFVVIPAPSTDRLVLCVDRNNISRDPFDDDRGAHGSSPGHRSLRLLQVRHPRRECVTFRPERCFAATAELSEHISHRGPRLLQRNIVWQMFQPRDSARRGVSISRGVAVLVSQLRQAGRIKSGRMMRNHKSSRLILSSRVTCRDC